MYHSQADIRLYGNTFTTLPRIVPGRMNTDDFVFFSWPHTINPRDYIVVVQANDTAGPEWRSIGELTKEVLLPEVQFDAYSDIMVIPKRHEGAPRFIARLNRGSGYSIPDVSRRPRTCENIHVMGRCGHHTASVNEIYKC